jgi:hypothetical protein
MGLMVEGTLHHYVLFIWEMVYFITKSHKMGSHVLKRTEAIIAFLEFAEPKDVMVINTRNKAYAPKGKFDPPHSSSSPSSSSTAATSEVP